MEEKWLRWGNGSPRQIANFFPLCWLKDQESARGNVFCVQSLSCRTHLLCTSCAFGIKLCPFSAVPQQTTWYTSYIPHQPDIHPDNLIKMSLCHEARYSVLKIKSWDKSSTLFAALDLNVASSLGLFYNCAVRILLVIRFGFYSSVQFTLELLCL